MKTGRNYKFWFCTGSQDLYGTNACGMWRNIPPSLWSI